MTGALRAVTNGPTGITRCGNTSARTSKKPFASPGSLDACLPMFPLAWMWEATFGIAVGYFRRMEFAHGADVTTRAATVTVPRMKSTRFAGSLAACSLLLLASAAAAAEPASPEKTGVAVGQKAPGFTLKD